MEEIYRSNDPVKLSWIEALLSEAGIDSYQMDLHASVLEGSIGAIPRRIMVLGDDYSRAIRILQDAGELEPVTDNQFIGKSPKLPFWQRWFGRE
ncbi:putative signal transducing protein [Kiloniella sp. b19]|uniref:putative signal transducing protein n=1 Tax=Kiloniella sp. GXU_MW_B19 TaxID=3141326 RepID=UPI0031D77FEA